MVGGRHPPPARTASLLLLLLGLLLHRAAHLLPSRDSCRRRATYLPFFFFVAFFFAIGITSFRDRSVTHRLAPQVLGLLAPPALVVHEVGVQLRQAHDLEPALLEGAIEHSEVVGRQEVERAVRLGGRSQAKGPRDRLRIALEIAVDGGQPEARRQQSGPRVQGEGVPAPLGARDPHDLTHELSRDALRCQVRGALVGPIGVGLAPALEQVGRLRQPQSLTVVALDPCELLEPLDDVVGVTEAHPGRAPELLESPGPTGLDEQHADDPRRARGEERPERPGGGTDVPLAFLLDQGVLEREVTVARQVHESEVVALEDARALRTDVDRAGYRVGARKLPADLVQLRHGSTDLPRLAQRCDLDDDRVLLAGQLESSHQIGCLRSDLGSDGFLPALCLREELPKSLGHLPPNLLGFQHLSLAPGISASAETIRRNESACQEKTYVSTLEQ